jgi:hypothetical protein
MDVVLDVTGIKEDRDAAFDAIVQHTGHLITTQPLEPKDKPSFLQVRRPENDTSAFDYVADRHLVY